MTVHMGHANRLVTGRAGVAAPSRPGTSPVDLLADFHRAGSRPLTVLIDLLLVAVAGRLAQLPPTTAGVVALALVGTLLVTGRYRRRSPLEAEGTMWYLSLILAPTVVAMAACAYGLSLSASRTAAVAAWSIAALVGLRAMAWALIVRLRSRGVGCAATALVGSGPTVERIRELLFVRPHMGLDPILTVAPDDERLSDPVLLTELVVCHGVDHVLVVADAFVDEVLDELRYLRGPMVDVSVVPGSTSLFLNPDRFSRLGGIALVPVGSVGQATHSQLGKRILDIFLASVALVVLLPLLVAIAIAIKLGDGGPVLYRQRRVGQWGRRFLFLKFRSMVPDADQAVIDLRDRNATDGLLFKVCDDPRVTTVGRIIRRLSIDELPQLLNVLKGDMSLVGPRPLPVEPTDFGERDGLRHQVPPGITGLWQVSGDNGLTYDEMIRLDLAYIRTWSLWLDLRLMFLTLPALLRRLGPS